MQEYLKYNLNSYLYQDKNKYLILIIIPFLMFGLVIWYTYIKEVYVTYEVSASTTCNSNDCTIRFYKEINEPFIYEYIKINNQKYEIEEVFYGNKMLDSLNNAIQELVIKAKEYKGNNNEFVKLKIYKNKEKLINKIYKVVKER